MFVRGGVYRVVRQAMGDTLAKLSVSALLFDYVLTGPISAVTAGQYLAGFIEEVALYLKHPIHFNANYFAAAFGILAILYFWWKNIQGIHESSDKALWIMRVELVSAKTPPLPRGKAFYLRNRNSLVFVASNLAPLAPDKIYELWLFPKSGGPPIAAGLFKPDLNGSATVVNPPLPAGVEAKAFAVTLEPESGPHDVPRGTAVMQSGA